jgi:hypothetical protein
VVVVGEREFFREELDSAEDQAALALAVVLSLGESLITG